MPDRPPPTHTEIDESLPPGVRPTSYCPPVALLRAYQEQVLPLTLASEIAEHLQHCGLCPVLLADLEHFPQPAITADERQRIRHTIPSPLQTPSWRWYTSFATATALILAAIFLVLHHPTSTPAQTGHTAQPNQPTPATLPPQSHLEVAKLDPPLELAPGLVLRGAAPSDQPTPDQLTPAFTAYTQSDYPLAAQLFSELAKQFPRADIPFLYLGVTQLLQNDSAAALPNLARAEQLATASRKDTAAWYHALAATQAHSPEAPVLLHFLCLRKKTPYSPQACQLEKNRSADPR
jgi:hypothetical protein